jgi:succinyl-diaminopimelate desuccinylase
MKAGLAVALTVASLVRELEVPLAGRLTLAFASDEETGGQWGTQWLLGNVAAVRGDACLIGESSGTWSAGIGEKGVLWLRLHSRGVSGHAAYQQGVSAVTAMRAALASVERMHGRKARGDKAVARVIARQRGAAERRWGRGTGRLADTLAVSVGTVQGGGQVNLIPEAAMAEVDFRVPPGLTTGSVEKEARRRIKEAARSRVEVVAFNQCDPYVTSPDAALVKLVLANAKTLNRRTVLPVVRLGYTDGRFFRRASIPTVVYGPAVHNMGGPDEYIEIADLLEVAAVHAGAVLDLLAPGAA